MAQHLVLKDFEGIYDDQNWRLRAGEIVDDATPPITPVAALRGFGLATVPYVAGTMAAMVTAYLEAHDGDADRPSMMPWLMSYSIAANTGVLADITAGSEGALLVGTDAKGNLGASTTVEAALEFINTQDCASAAELASVTPASEGALLVGTDAKTTLGAAATVEAALEYLDDGQYDAGEVAVAQIIQAGQPVAAETLTIGADVYEADGVGANINFVIGGTPAETMANLLTEIVANGTENLFADAIGATVIRLRSADAPQGNVVAANPNIAVTEAMTNYIFDCGNVNLNTLGGRVAGQSRIVVGSLPLNAGHIAAGEARISFPADVTDAVVQLSTATNVAHAIGTDSWTIDNGDILITLPGGGAPDAVAGDIVRVVAVL